MNCPECKGHAQDKGTGTATSRLRNLGGRTSYATVTIRRYLCEECGYAFFTEEKHSGPINRRSRLDQQSRYGSEGTLFGHQ
jgi:hypothetical protein